MIIAACFSRSSWNIMLRGGSPINTQPVENAGNDLANIATLTGWSYRLSVKPPPSTPYVISWHGRVVTASPVFNHMYPLCDPQTLRSQSPKTFHSTATLQLSPSTIISQVGSLTPTTHPTSTSPSPLPLPASIHLLPSCLSLTSTIPTPPSPTVHLPTRNSRSHTSPPPLLVLA